MQQDVGRRDWRGLPSPVVLVAIGLVALAMRLVYLGLVERRGLFFGLFLDSTFYASRAAWIRGGHGIGAHPYLMSPLYPYFLALFTDTEGQLDVRLVQIAQAVAGSGTAVLTALIAGRMAGRAAAVLAGLLVALYGPLVHGDSQILVTALQTFFLTLSLWLLLGSRDSWRRALAAGGAFGVTAALQPTALVLAAVAATLLVALGRTKPALALLCGTALLVAPFTIRNVVYGGESVLLSANAGINFWVGNAAGANGLYRLPPSTDWMSDPLSKHAAERESGRAMTYREVSRFWFRRAAHDVRAAPLEWLKLLARKTLYFVHPTEISQLGTSFDWYRERAWPLRLPLDARFFFLVILVSPLVWRSAATGARPCRTATLCTVTLLATYAATICLFFVTDRHRLPILPAAIALASSTLVVVTRLLGREARRSAPFALVGPVAAALVLAWASHVLYTGPRAPFHVATVTGLEERHRGMALYEAGRYAEAVEAYRASLAVAEDPITRNNLANALIRAGRAEEAVGEYRRALERDPESGLAWYNYGILLDQGLHDVARAEEAFLNAIRYAPGMPDAHYRLGRLYLATGRPDAATRVLARAIELCPPASPLLDEAREALDVARTRAGSDVRP